MLQSQAHGTNGCSEGHPVDRKATFFLLAPSLQCEVFASLMQYSVADRKIGVLMLEEEEKKKKKQPSGSLINQPDVVSAVLLPDNPPHPASILKPSYVCTVMLPRQSSLALSHDGAFLCILKKSPICGETSSLPPPSFIRSDLGALNGKSTTAKSLN